MKKLLIARIGFYFFITCLTGIVGLGSYLLAIGDLSSTSMIRGVIGIIICISGISSMRKAITNLKKEQLETTPPNSY